MPSFDKFSLLDPAKEGREIDAAAETSVMDRFSLLDDARARVRINSALDAGLNQFDALDHTRAMAKIAAAAEEEDEKPTPENPVMRLEFETLVGTTLVESVNGFASVAEGTAPALFAPGIVGANGMTFNGADNYVSVDGTGGHFETDSFSYSTWTKNVVPTQATRFLSKNDLNGYTSFYFLDDGSDPLSIVALGYLEGAMGVTAVSAVWSIADVDVTEVRHFVWTYDHTASQNWELYIDKVKQTAWNRSNNGVGVKLAKTNDAALWIGASNDVGTPSSFFNGDRDDAWWFGRAITQEEVDMLYDLETEED